MAVSGSFELSVLVMAGVTLVCFGVGAYCALPGPLRQRSQRCSVRKDGTYSRRRAEIERRFRFKFAVEAMSGIAMVSLPVLALGFLIHQWVVPADMAFDALAQFDGDPEVWRERLDGDSEGSVRNAHSNWAERNSYSADGTQNLQALAWNGWPVVLTSFVGVAVACFLLTLAYLKRLSKRFARQLNHRCEEYLFIDIEEEAKAVTRSTLHKLARKGNPPLQLW